MRSSKRDNFCYRFLRLALLSASAIAALVVFASRLDAQQQTPQTPQTPPAAAPTEQSQAKLLPPHLRVKSICPKS
jgi:hypothetical protein